jgi:uncharacterized protein (TIGR02594 family)
MRSLFARICHACWHSAFAWAMAICLGMISPLAWQLSTAGATHHVIKKDQARIVPEARDLATVPVLYTREDPWIVNEVRTTGYGRYYYEEATRPKDEEVAPRIEVNEKAKKKQKRSAVEPSALIAYAKADIGKRGPQLGLPSRLWCMDFITRVLKRVGLPSTGSRMARSPLTNPNFVRVAKPAPGDIVVIARGRSSVYGHVALYNGSCGKGGIRMLGGNQRGGRVTDDCVRGRAVVGYVRPKAIASDTVQVADSAPAKAIKTKAKKLSAKRAVRHAQVKPEKPFWPQEHS